MKNKIIFSIVMFFLSISLFSQETNTFGDVEDEINSFLGFSLTSSGGGGLVHFALIRRLYNGKMEVTQISRDKFFRIAQGKESNAANPKLINFFKKYNIKDSIVYELWRLRYKEYPYQTLNRMGSGWAMIDTTYKSENIRASQIIKPSIGQMQILKGYGMERLGDYIYGENAFKLLYDMIDEQWKNIYKTSSY